LLPLPAPEFEVLSARFERFLRPDSRLEKLFSGMRWAEGPVYLPAFDSVVVSDIPNDRLLRWSVREGVRVFREPSNFANGNTIDREGRLVTCEHRTCRVTRTERDGRIEILADRFEGKRLNSPNDVVVKSDGSIWFSDSTYGLVLEEFGGVAPQEQAGAYLFRLESESGRLEAVAEDFVAPNGLCFSPDERQLYVTDSGGDLSTSLEAQSDPAGGLIPEPHHIRVFEVVGGRTLANGRLFADMAPGVPDGVRVDTEGHLWAAAIDGVRVYAPDGIHLGTIRVPEVTANLCFGGLERDTLFIAATTSLYRVRVNCRGL